MVHGKGCMDDGKWGETKGKEGSERELQYPWPWFSLIIQLLIIAVKMMGRERECEMTTHFSTSIIVRYSKSKGRDINEAWS